MKFITTISINTKPCNVYYDELNDCVKYYKDNVCIFIITRKYIDAMLDMGEEYFTKLEEEAIKIFRNNKLNTLNIGGNFD